MTPSAVSCNQPTQSRLNEGRGTSVPKCPGIKVKGRDCPVRGSLEKVGVQEEKLSDRKSTVLVRGRALATKWGFVTPQILSVALRMLTFSTGFGPCCVFELSVFNHGKFLLRALVCQLLRKLLSKQLFPCSHLDYFLPSAGFGLLFFFCPGVLFCGSHGVCIKCSIDENTPFSADGRLSTFAVTGSNTCTRPLGAPPDQAGGVLAFSTETCPVGAPGTVSPRHGHTPSAITDHG